MNVDLLFQESLERAGDPRLAEAQWRELRPALPPESLRTDALRFLFALFGNSRFAVERLLRAPDPGAAAAALIDSPRLLQPKSAAEMSAELKATLPDAASLSLPLAQKRLREYKYAEISRIAARDLSGAFPHEEIGRELAALAEACVEGALKMAVSLVPGAGRIPFAVLALGKFGGEDLNFSSDIDLIYVHGCRSSSEEASRADLEDACRIAETLTRLLDERTEDGFVFRVDLDLRPEGKSGVLVNSSEAFAAYYETSGASWERAALTKARCVAGDRQLGARALAAVEPFVYPRHLDSSAVDGLKAMKAKINAEIEKTKGGGFHLKLGRGGIREIEFFVTAFQLIYGGKDPSLKERHTLAALKLLKEKGLVPAGDAAGLEDAYLFLRRAENRLQMEDERQTHRLPTAREDLTAVARRMGFASAADFEKALKDKTDFVFSCFERLAS